MVSFVLPGVKISLIKLCEMDVMMLSTVVSVVLHIMEELVPSHLDVITTVSGEVYWERLPKNILVAHVIQHHRVCEVRVEHLGTVSGDGLIHEVVTGVLDRNDWNTAVDVPDLGQVRFRDTVTPGGGAKGIGNEDGGEPISAI